MKLLFLTLVLFVVPLQAQTDVDLKWWMPQAERTFRGGTTTLTVSTSETVYSVEAWWLPNTNATGVYTPVFITKLTSTDGKMWAVSFLTKSKPTGDYKVIPVAMSATDSVKWAGVSQTIHLRKR